MMQVSVIWSHLLMYNTRWSSPKYCKQKS